jgi:hypothetical protein
MTSSEDRKLTDHERRLVEWMLRHGSPEAVAFIPQLEKAEVTPWRCDCGCASFNFRIKDKPEPLAGTHPIADFLFSDGETLGGIFVYESGGILGGLEMYRFGNEARVEVLPEPVELRPFVSD